MREHLRFSVVYWHTFRNRLSDPFGMGTALRPWDDGTESVENAQNRARAAVTPQRYGRRFCPPYIRYPDRCSSAFSARRRAGS